MRAAFVSAAALALTLAWIAAATVLADGVSAWPTLARLAYFAVAGFAWVFPVWGLLLLLRKRT